MTQSVAHVMTPDPHTLPASATAMDAARLMAEGNIGDVLVTRDDGTLCGVVTDRDLVVRVMAVSGDSSKAMLGEVCSGDPITVSPTDAVDRSVLLMRRYALRRLPVVDGGKVVGIVSLGDLAMEKDPDSALADISRATPNN